MLPDLAGFSPEEEARIQALVRQGIPLRDARVRVLEQRPNPQGPEVVQGEYFQPSQPLTIVPPQNPAAAGVSRPPQPVPRRVTPRPGVPQQPRDASLLGGAPPAARPTASPAALRQPRDASLLQSMLAPFQGGEGKMRLLEVLGGLGQAYLGGRAQAGAEKRTARSQAAANLTNALSRRARSQGVVSAARPGMGFSLMGALAGAGQMGQQAAQQQREMAQQEWERGMRERGEGREDTRVGFEGRRVEQGERGLEYEGRRVENERTRIEQDAREAAARERLGFAGLRQQGDEQAATQGYRNRLLDLKEEEIAARAEAAQAKAQQGGQRLDQDAVKRIRNAQQARRQVAILRAQRNKAESVKVDPKTGKPRDTGLAGAASSWRRGLPGFQRGNPGVATYNRMARAAALNLAVASQGAKPSEEDRKVWEEMIPDLTESIAVQEAKFVALDEMVGIAADLAEGGLMIATNGMPLLVTFDEAGRPTIDRTALSTVIEPATGLAEDEEGEGEGPELDEVDFDEEP